MLIHLFGGLELLSAAGDPIRSATRKTSLLLAILALLGDKGARRDTLCELLWSDRAEAQARGSLRQALAALRQLTTIMAPDVVHIEADLETAKLVVKSPAVDTHLFERLIRQPDAASLAAAADLYRGDLLEGFALPTPLDQWFAPHRQAFRNNALTLCEQLSQMISTDGTKLAGPCENLARRLLSTEPSAEEAHRALIRMHLLNHRENAARQQFERCRQALRNDLGAEPEPQTSALLKVPSPVEVAIDPVMKEAPLPTAPAFSNVDRPSIVVMPFDNLSTAEDDYFVDGVVEEITAALSCVRDFFVIARQSAFTYKKRFVDVREVGRELGVRYVVEGTVRRGGDRLRISVQLVDAETRTQLWSERYEGAVENIFEFQDRIAAQVAGAIHPAIRGAEIEQATRKPPTSLRAYDLVMQAYQHLWGRSKDANAKAIALLEKAVAVDPGYGRAHALLAWSHAANATYLWTEHPGAELDEALSALQAAGALGDDPTALTAAGAAMSLYGDQQRASYFIEKALALDPNNAWAWTRLGWIAIYTNEAARAPEWFGRAMTLSPRDPLTFNMKIGLAASMAMTGNLTPAIAIARELITSHPDVLMSYRFLATWAAMAGDLDTARWAAGKLLAAQPDFTIEKFCSLPMFRGMADWPDKVAKALKLAGLPER